MNLLASRIRARLSGLLIIALVLGTLAAGMYVLWPLAMSAKLGSQGMYSRRLGEVDLNSCRVQEFPFVLGPGVDAPEALTLEFDRSGQHGWHPPRFDLAVTLREGPRTLTTTLTNNDTECNWHAPNAGIILGAVKAEDLRPGHEYVIDLTLLRVVEAPEGVKVFLHVWFTTRR
jgi:hypothetical protein